VAAEVCPKQAIPQGFQTGFITWSYHRYEYVQLEEYLNFRHIDRMNQDIAKQPNLTGKTVFSPARQS
jgi:hypothetical protein